MEHLQMGTFLNLQTVEYTKLLGLTCFISKNSVLHSKKKGKKDYYGARSYHNFPLNKPN
jgi:hypothetical protein